MKTILLSLTICMLSLTGCYDERVIIAPTQEHPNFGCVIVNDSFGEREICDVQYYYMADGSSVYYDAYFHIWVSPTGYLYGGRWVAGAYPGYYSFYRSHYHPHGFYRNYYHYRGGYHGGFHGGFHGERGGHR